MIVDHDAKLRKAMSICFEAFAADTKRVLRAKGLKRPKDFNAIVWQTIADNAKASADLSEARAKGSDDNDLS